MSNWNKWAIALGAAALVALLQAAEESSSWLEFGKHFAHMLLPTVVSLKMTLLEKNKDV